MYYKGGDRRGEGINKRKKKKSERENCDLIHCLRSSRMVLERKLIGVARQFECSSRSDQLNAYRSMKRVEGRSFK